MGMDRNTVIGFVLIGVLLLIYLVTSTKATHELEAQRQRAQDSIAAVKAKQAALEHAKDTAAVKAPAPDSTLTGFNKAARGTERFTTIENDVIKVVFSNKGGQPVSVTLKQYKAYDSNDVKLIPPGSANRLMYNISTGQNMTADIADLYFDDAQVVRNGDGSQTISYRLPTPEGESLIHQFTVRPNDYLVDWNVEIGNPAALFYQNSFILSWQAQLDKTQRDVHYERRQASVSYMEDGRFDYMVAKTEKTLDKPVQWVAVSQQFFNTTLIAKNGWSSGEIHLAKETSDTSNVVERTQINLQTKLPALAQTVLPMQIYYGPNDFHILERQAEGMTKIIDLGRGMYSFVRPINVYVIMPVFNFFKSHIASYGLVILLLTFFIRLFTSPLVYSSYLSGAKMKALRPEIEAMKKRVGNDQQQVGMEQMKLFREAGVNPLGGCIPALLQIPIFFALYSFFNTYMGLRGQTFLWSHDLSSYDSILHLGFSIPAFGDHVSLFALMACTTSFLISLYGMSMTPDQSNPAMKYMPYVMPVFLLLFFNGLPSALTWYYTVSNLVTLSLQFVIQRYIIDHDKILAKLKENRAKPKTKSKWQQRLEQMQEAQKQAQKKTPNGRK
ncbi:MAG TPA: membrane protein insertase YidC [Puia sp.]|nr:membrane protein insertase YidC [Puia sp.]